VARFVVDECHQITTCDSYRLKFNAVKELAQYPVQKIFLTATLPVSLEDYFLEQSYLPRSTLVLREPTNRPNLMYHLLRVEKRVRKATDVITDMAQLVERELWTEASRGIIFCLSRSDVDEVAAFFNNTKSHSHMNGSDRSELQEKWSEGHAGHRWMVATTGFIHGIDHPNVDTVIFLEMPYGLVNFVQGAGRAGRSGRVAHIFMLDYCLTFVQPPVGSVDTGATEKGTEFVVNNSHCRRTLLSEVMDGLPITCDDLMDVTKCDICNPGHPMAIATKKLLLPPRSDSPEYDQGCWDDATLGSLDISLLSSTPSSSSMPTTAHSVSSASLLLDHAIYLNLKENKKGKVAELTELTKVVGGILDGNNTGYCVICWVWKKKRQQKTPDHQYFISCKSEEDRFVHHAIGWIDMKRGFRFAKYQYCWTCGLPQGEYTPATHPCFKPGVVMNCPFDDVVALLIWHIINTVDVWKRACSAFKALRSTMHLADIKKWLMVVDGPHLFYNGLELVVWFWVTYKKDYINT
jgi:Helicase conserved C-terminal domain